MPNGMTPTQPTPHNRPYLVPTPKILIPPSKSGKNPSPTRSPTRWPRGLPTRGVGCTCNKIVGFG